MPTYYERAQAAEDPILIDRTRQALVKWVVYQFGGTPAAPDIRLGKQVLASPNAFARLFAIGVAQSDFYGDGTSSDPSTNDTQGDTALSGIVEATLWPIFTTETP